MNSTDRIKERLRGDCDDEANCQNAGQQCNHCTRSYYYEEESDCFMEKIE